MRSWIAIGFIAVVVCGCTPSAVVPVVSSGSSPAPSAPSGPVVECLDLDRPTCDRALTIVLQAVAPSGWTPTHVWFSSGSLAPVADLLFDPHANFPLAFDAARGTLFGSSEVAFAETDRHAGLNLYSKGSEVLAKLVGYAVPRPDWCSGNCPTSASVDGRFRLELVLPRVDWKASEPITGSAILSVEGPSPVTVYGSGTVLNFAYAEVGGSRKVEPVWTSDCAAHVLDPATAMTGDLAKSGGVSDADPDAAFLRSFFAADGVRLPAGTWDVTALAMFDDVQGCSGGAHSIAATERITVKD